MIQINKKGFTILELLIATMVFSVVFLGATTAILQLGKLYYKGVITSRTQEIVRSVADSISQELQFSSDKLNTSPADYPDYQVTKIQNGAPSGSQNLKFSAYCIGTTRFTYVLNAQVDNKSLQDSQYDPSNLRLAHALWRDTISPNSCLPANLSLANPTNTAEAPGISGTGQEMLGIGMRLTIFSVSCHPPSNGPTANICNLSMRIIYGDNDILAPAPSETTIPTHCEAIVGSQWCATSELNTTVLKRVVGEN